MPKRTVIKEDIITVEYKDQNGIYLTGFDWCGMNEFELYFNEEEAEVLVRVLSNWLKQKKNEIKE